jgi:AhpD family alkylhydroperoxidase
MDDKTKELIAIGSSIAANCHPCIKYHLSKAKELGIAASSIYEAVRVGMKVRQGAAGEMDNLLKDLTGTVAKNNPGCCG